MKIGSDNKIGWENVWPSHLGWDSNHLYEHGIAKETPLFSLSGKTNDKTTNLSSIFEYLDVTWLFSWISKQMFCKHIFFRKTTMKKLFDNVLIF